MPSKKRKRANTQFNGVLCKPIETGICQLRSEEKRTGGRLYAPGCPRKKKKKKKKKNEKDLKEKKKNRITAGEPVPKKEWFRKLRGVTCCRGWEPLFRRGENWMGDSDLRGEKESSMGGV